MAWIISGMDSSFSFHDAKTWVHTSSELHQQILSIGQDIIYAAHTGRVKTPKHIAFPMAVWHTTGSAQLVTLLNKFGHGISYSQLEELDTSLAEQMLHVADDLAFIPMVFSLVTQLSSALTIMTF